MKRLVLLFVLPVAWACGSGSTSGGDAAPADDVVAEAADGVQADITIACKEGSTEPCGSDEGACVRGERSCTDGQWGECEGGVGPADEVCNGQDDDCDGLTDDGQEVTAVSCGVGACAAVGTRSCTAGAEVDDCTPGQPAADDATCDGVDDDCDGTTDEDFQGDVVTCGVGACTVSTPLVCEDGKLFDLCTPGTGASDDPTCDGLDDDCDGATDEDYAPVVVSCGAGSCLATGTTACQGGVVIESCSPADGTGTDPICNGLDDDCDGVTDDDYVSVPTACGVGACAHAGQRTCVEGAEVDSCAAGTPAATDATCDGLDDDCDGTADDDVAALPSACGVGACASTGFVQCVSGQLLDSCKARAGAPLDLTCDGVDDDCDGTADDDYAALPVTCGTGACLAQGTTACVDGAIVSSCSPGGPEGSDAVCNGLDDDCDGVTDDDFEPAPLTCGTGACEATGDTACVDGHVVDACTPGTPAAGDDCNGLDDDCDGTVDEDFAGEQTSCGLGACAATGGMACVAGQVVDTCAPGQPLGLDDPNCDAIDDDCDGTADDDFEGEQTSCGTGACEAWGGMACVEGQGIDTCTPGQPLEPFDTTCDEIDGDCDGQTDEDAFDDDGDGLLTWCWGGGLDNCPLVANADQADLDHDDVGDACDPDDDGDGWLDGEDNCPRKLNVDQQDLDGDGVGDACDPDLDGDGIPNEVDNCPTVSNPTQAPGCHDLIGAACDPDEDCDGVMNDADNCPVVYNPGQDDTDHDGLGDACDGDCDGDGVPNHADNCPCTPGGNDQADLDADGLGDLCDPDVDGDGDPNDTDCDDHDPMVGTGFSDALCDGVDNDCDGTPDDGFTVTPTECGTGVCHALGLLTCSAGATHDSCAPGLAVAETCNGLDDDCDGAVDDGGDDACALLLERPAACLDGACRATCALPSDCLWSDWLVDCLGHWACTSGLCQPQCGEPCGNLVCEPAKGEDALTCAGDCVACTTNADCKPTQFCELAEGACGGEGSCLNRPGACPLAYVPVCGCDGVTYDNACLRRAAGVPELHPGACVAPQCVDAEDCLGTPWQVKCWGHWTCVDKACQPACGTPCGDGLCDPAKGEDAATCAPDCEPPKPTAFRADTLALVAPTLCYPLGGGCLDVTTYANQLIAAQLVDPTDPIDLLGVFTPLDLAVTDGVFDLHDGTCTRDANGVILSCGPTTGATPNVFAPPVYATDGTCLTDPATVAAPCFRATAEDARFRLLGALFGLLDPTVASSFVADSTGGYERLSSGVIHGFLPQALAAKLTVSTGLGTFTLSDLLAAHPTEVHEGTTGWWLTFSFAAARVPFAP